MGRNADKIGRFSCGLPKVRVFPAELYSPARQNAVYRLTRRAVAMEDREELQEFGLKSFGFIL